MALLSSHSRPAPLVPLVAVLSTTCLALACHEHGDASTTQTGASALPDLAVESIDSSGYVENPLSLAASGQIRATVINLGPAGLPSGASYEVLAFHDANGNGRYDAGVDPRLGTEAVPASTALPATATITVGGTALFRGAPLHVVVDADDSVVEEDETNNVLDGHATCFFLPSAANFDPIVEWEWTSPTTLPLSRGVHSTPAVGDLDGDGVPEIVFPSAEDLTTSLPIGELRAIRGTDGSEVFTVTDPAWKIRAHASIAIGDLDGDGPPEIVAVAEGTSMGQELLVFESDGTPRLRTDVVPPVVWGAISLADLFGDGLPEIVVGNCVLAADGALLSSDTGPTGFNNNAGPFSLVADIDLDGVPEIVAGSAVYTNTSIPHPSWTAVPGEGYAAVANFDADPEAEVVVVSEVGTSGAGEISLYDTDGSRHPGWSGGSSMTFPGMGLGGPPTVADFDSDGAPEVGVAGRSRYAVIDTDGSVLWSEPTVDTSSHRTGSSVFDFNGDGSAEVVYGDQETLFVFAGSVQASGTQVIFDVPRSSLTWCEYPLVVDVDGDGNAEIVDVQNDGPPYGIRVFGDPHGRWVDTRKVWNQHTYHITNVEDDLSIPVVEPPHWLTPAGAPFNSFRQNTLSTAAPSLAPDLTASFPRVASATSVVARVGNAGSLATSGPVLVALYASDPAVPGTQPLSVASTTAPLDVGAFEDVVLDIAGAVPAAVWVVADDDGAGAELELECDEDNNDVGGAPITMP